MGRIRLPLYGPVEKILEHLTFIFQDNWLGWYYDRGDPSSYDFAVGDLTTDGTWNDLDLSSIVPENTQAVHMHATVLDDAVGNQFAFRKNGNSNTRNILRGYTQVANNYEIIDGIVACDSDRIIEYYGSNTTWTSIDILVRGYWK